MIVGYYDGERSLCNQGEKRLCTAGLTRGGEQVQRIRGGRLSVRQSA